MSFKLEPVSHKTRCSRCPYLNLDDGCKLYADQLVKEIVFKCDHEDACDRAYYFGYKDGKEGNDKYALEEC